MRIFLLSVVLFGAFALAACKDEAANQPSTATSSPPPVPATPAKSVAKIVAFGDSLTAGFGLAESQSYPALLQKRLNDAGYSYDVVNAGVSGDTSAGGLRRIDWALEGDVKVVIIELGANDILRFQPIAAMKKNLAAIIERAQAKGARVLLAGMEAPTNSGPDYRRETHDAYVDLAQQYKVPLIPFFLQDVAGIEALNQNDGIHPNAEGTKRVAETVYKYLEPMLEK